MVKTGKKERKIVNKRIRARKKVRKKSLRWSAKCSSEVRSCLFCRLSWGKFKVNWPTHGFFFFHLLFLLLLDSTCGQRVTDKIYSLPSFIISVSLSELLTFSLSAFQLSEHSTDWLHRLIRWPCLCTDCSSARTLSLKLCLEPLETAVSTAPKAQMCWMKQTEY